MKTWEPGTPAWTREIENNLRDCDAVVVLMSPNAYESRWVRRECTKALQKGKKIFPLLMAGNPEDHIPLELCDIQHIDLRWQFDDGVNVLIKTFRRRGYCKKEVPATKKPLSEMPENPVKAVRVERKPVFTSPATSALKLGSEMTITLAEGVEMAFVYVPAGEFWMGSDDNDPDALDNEKPKHKLYLDGYWIGKYTVTNIQYAAFVNAQGYKQPKYWKNGSIPEEKAIHPVVSVSWHDAQAFCAWASQVSGKSIYLPARRSGKRRRAGRMGANIPGEY